MPQAIHKRLLRRNSQKPSFRRGRLPDATNQAAATVTNMAGHWRKSKTFIRWTSCGPRSVVTGRFAREDLTAGVARRLTHVGSPTVRRYRRQNRRDRRSMEATGRHCCGISHGTCLQLACARSDLPMCADVQITSRRASNILLMAVRQWQLSSALVHLHQPEFRTNSLLTD
jgi:hypothetical protein